MDNWDIHIVQVHDTAADSRNSVPEPLPSKPVVSPGTILSREKVSAYRISLLLNDSIQDLKRLMLIRETDRREAGIRDFYHRLGEQLARITDWKVEEIDRFMCDIFPRSVIDRYIEQLACFEDEIRHQIPSVYMSGQPATVTRKDVLGETECRRHPPLPDADDREQVTTELLAIIRNKERADSDVYDEAMELRDMDELNRYIFAETDRENRCSRSKK